MRQSRKVTDRAYPIERRHDVKPADDGEHLMSAPVTVPGVGPVVALTYRASVDMPARFRKSKSVGAVFGLTCSRNQSGERDRPKPASDATPQSRIV